MSYSTGLSAANSSYNSNYVEQKRQEVYDYAIAQEVKLQKRYQYLQALSAFETPMMKKLDSLYAAEGVLKHEMSLMSQAASKGNDASWTSMDTHLDFKLRTVYDQIFSTRYDMTTGYDSIYNEIYS